MKELIIIVYKISVAGLTRQQVIYPITQSYSFTPEVNDLIVEISDKIKNDPTNGFRTQWNRLVRELKLIKISSTI